MHLFLDEATGIHGLSLNIEWRILSMGKWKKQAYIAPSFYKNVALTSAENQKANS